MVGDILIFTEGKPADAEIKPASYHTFVLDLIADLRAKRNSRMRASKCKTNARHPRPVQSAPPQPRFLQPRPQRHRHDAQRRHDFSALHCDEKEIVTEIEDPGPGIAPEIADKLFEAFATFGKPTAPASASQSAKKSFEDHKGRIWARNEPGRGAVFAFALPLP